MASPVEKVILVTGATGYIGGRLVPLLVQSGYKVRCLARRPEVLRNRHFSDAIEVVEGDVLKQESLSDTLKGIHTAYYLVHSLGVAHDFEKIEVQGAKNFAEAAWDAGVKKIIYLGGLSDEYEEVRSAHMRSRWEVGNILRQSGIPTIEFRASIIIGSGSLSFELIRALVGRLPIMITPRWVRVKAQPIAVADVLKYLVAALEMEIKSSTIYEIGGSEPLSYGDLMKIYASIRGLRRLIIPVPLLTPWLSSLWLSLVTPLYAQVGRKLIESMTVPSVVRNPSARSDFAIVPMGIREAIEQALRNEDNEYAETHWADALSSVGSPRRWGGIHFRNRIVDSRSVDVLAPPQRAFIPIARIGGTTGWYYGNILWIIRGLIDRAVGGVGMNRGRRDPENLRVGDVIDCWRVEQVNPPYRLLLAAEMKLPGRAWLQFEVEPTPTGSRITQTAIFDPIGLSGLFYWYSLYIIHQFVFAGMLCTIANVIHRSLSEIE